MRKSVMPGLLLVLASVLVVLISAALELELESVALLGVAVGGLLAVVPDRTPVVRLSGFGVGVVVVWVGYLLRAAMLPDSAGGRAVFVGVVLLACVLIAAAADRLPLWSALLGVAAFAGAFELTYAAAPPEVVGNSLSAVTALLLTVAAGFAAMSVHAHGQGEPRRRAHVTPAHDDTHQLDDLMTEKTQ